MSPPRHDVSYSSGHAEIRAWFYPAAGDSPAPAVVFCPGFTGTKHAAFYQPYVERFVAHGRSVLLLDYRGWGESDGPRGEIVPQRQVADIRSSLSYLETRDDVDAGRLALFGVSFGGGNAVYAAGVDERIRCCVAVSPVADGAAWLRGMRREHEWHELQDRLAADRRARVRDGAGEVVDPGEEILVPTPERRATRVKGDVADGLVPDSTPLWCAQEIAEFLPRAVAHRISPRALLLFHISRDAVVPADHARSLHAAAFEPRRIVELPGTQHYAAYVDHFDTIAEETIGWLRAYGA